MSSNRVQQLIDAGVWLKLSGDHAGARKLFEQALRLDPENARAKKLLAERPADAVPAAPDSPPPPRNVANPFARPPSIDSEWGELVGGQATAGAIPPTSAPVTPLTGPAGPAAPTPARVSEPALHDAFGVENAWDTMSSPGLEVEGGAEGRSALDLVADPVRPPEGGTSEEVRTLLRGAKDLLELDDHSGAMELILKAQELAPDDPEVRRFRERSERTLLAMLESKLPPLDAVPRVKLKDDEIIWLNLDHRAGFVLAQIDGTVTFEDLFAVSGMSRLDTARILAQLIEEGVIAV